MPSTVIKALCATVALAGATAGVKLDPLPEEVRALCEQIADNENWTGRQWIFGVVNQPTAAYYLVDGYARRRQPKAGESAYFQSIEGGVYKVSGGQCSGDQARETFNVRDPNQIPRAVLQQLALDLAARLVRAAGGADSLHGEIRRLRVDFKQLSPELQEAFKPYFDAVK